MEEVIRNKRNSLYTGHFIVIFIVKSWENYNCTIFRDWLDKTYVDNVMSYKPLKLLCLIFNVEKLVEKSTVLS